MRVWSTDWWYDSESALESLHTVLSGLLEQSRAAAVVETVVVESGVVNEVVAGEAAVSEAREEG